MGILGYLSGKKEKLGGVRQYLDIPDRFTEQNIDWNNYKKKANLYLNRDLFKNSPITGDILTKSAKKAYKQTGKFVPVELALAQGQMESLLGQKGRSPETNPFNVGEFDDETTQTFKNTQEGVDAYYDLVARNYLQNKTLDDLLKDFTNTEGSPYATDPDYENKISSQMNYINNYLGDNLNDNNSVFTKKDTPYGEQIALDFEGIGNSIKPLLAKDLSYRYRKKQQLVKELKLPYQFNKLPLEKLQDYKEKRGTLFGDEESVIMTPESLKEEFESISKQPFKKGIPIDDGVREFKRRLEMVRKDIGIAAIGGEEKYKKRRKKMEQFEKGMLTTAKATWFVLAPLFETVRTTQNAVVPLVKGEGKKEALETAIGWKPYGQRSFVEFAPEEFAREHPVINNIAAIGIDVGLTYGLAKGLKRLVPKSKVAETETTRWIDNIIDKAKPKGVAKGKGRVNVRRIAENVALKAKRLDPSLNINTTIQDINQKLIKIIGNPNSYDDEGKLLTTLYNRYFKPGALEKFVFGKAKVPKGKLGFLRSQRGAAYIFSDDVVNVAKKVMAKHPGAKLPIAAVRTVAGALGKSEEEISQEEVANYILKQQPTEQPLIEEAKGEIPKHLEGIAKDLGIDKYVSDETVLWVDDYLQEANFGVKLKPIPLQLINELSKYKPDKPVKLYRGVRKDQRTEELGFESWSYSKETAEGFGKVISREISPDEIIVDFSKMPRKLQEELLHGFQGNVEKEVLVKSTEQSLIEEAKGEVLYHGTESLDFKEFKAPGSSGAIWASTAPNEAAKAHGGEGRVMAVKMDIKNPADLDKGSGHDIGVKAWEEETGEMWEEAFGNFALVQEPAVIEALKKAGYDGVTMVENGVRSFGVFEPRQIKIVQQNVHMDDREMGDYIYRPTKEPRAGGIVHEPSEYFQKIVAERGEKLVSREDTIYVDKDLTVRDIHGNKVTLHKGEEYTPYKTSSGKILLHDGESLVVKKSIYENAKGQLTELTGGEGYQTKDIWKGKKSQEVFDWKEPPVDIEHENLVTWEQHSGVWIEREFHEGEFVKDALAGMEKEGGWVYKIFNSAGEPFLEGDYWDTLESAKSRAEMELREGKLQGGTKYYKWILPGGENYRELLIQVSTPKPKVDLTELPEGYSIHKERFGTGDEAWVVKSPDGTPHVYSDIEKKDEVIKKFMSEFVSDIKEEESKFQSYHWDEPNVLAHIRMDDRYTPRGEKILFIEEIQSDWAKEGRKEGFRKKSFEELSETQEGRRKMVQKIKRTPLERDYLTVAEQKRVKRNLEAYLKGVINPKSLKFILSNQPYNIDFSELIGGVPYHPLIENWKEVALRKVLKEAVRGKYDAISWTTGQQQTDRYKLSKYISELKYWKSYIKGKEHYTVHAYRKSDDLRPDIEKDNLTKKELNNFIGKDVANKIIDSKNDTGTLKGVDLAIGGEWAKHFYNKIIPSLVEKMTKGDVKLEKISSLEERDISLEIARSLTRKGETVYVRDMGAPDVEITHEPAFNGFLTNIKPQYRDDLEFYTTYMNKSPVLRITPDIKKKIIDQPAAGSKGRQREPQDVTLPTSFEEIEAINIAINNPVKRTLLEHKIPLAATQGGKAAHGKYYFTLLRDSIKHVLEDNNTVKDIFGRSGTLSRIIDIIQPKGVKYQINDLDEEVMRHHEFIRKEPDAVMDGYHQARRDLLNRLLTQTGIPRDAFLSGANYRRYLLSLDKEKRERMKELAPKVANNFFHEYNDRLETIDSATEAGHFLFIQRNSVRGTGTGQAFFKGGGWLSGGRLSEKGKAGLKNAIREHSEFLKKGVKLTSDDAFEIIRSSGKGDFILSDSPYAGETGYRKGGFTIEQALELDEALDEFHERGGEFIYHDTYHPKVVEFWQRKGYKTFRVKVPSSFGRGSAVKNELLVMSTLTNPEYSKEGFYTRAVGNLPVVEGQWGAKPTGKVKKLVDKVDLPREEKKLARALYERAIEAEQDVNLLFDVIKENGKIAPYQKLEISGIRPEYEEYKGLPRVVKNKNGLPPDEMADTLNSQGFAFDDARDMFAAIAAQKEIKNLKPDDFREEAKEILQSEIGTKIRDVLKEEKPSKALLLLLLREAKNKRITQVKIGRMIRYMGKEREEPLSSGDVRKLLETIKDVYIKRGKPVLPKGKYILDEIPSEDKEKLIKEKVAALGLPFDDIETIFALRGYDPYAMTKSQQDNIIKLLGEVADNPDKYDRVRQIYEGMVEFTRRDVEREYNKILKQESRFREKRYNKLKRKMTKREDYHSLLWNTLRLANVDLMKDVRMSLGTLEVWSGIPFYNKHYQSIMTASNEKDIELQKIMDTLIKGLEVAPDSENQQNISAYFQAIFEGREQPVLSDEEKQLADNIREILDRFKPFVKKYRFLSWAESKMIGENKGLGKTDIENVDQETLEEGFKVLTEGGNIDQWLSEKDFGVVSRGYLPRQILAGHLHFPHYKVGTMSLKNLKPRTAKKDLSDVPLLKRVQSYLNRMLNLKYLDAPVHALDKDLSALLDKKNIPDSTVSALQRWVGRVKGYARDRGAIDKFLYPVQRALFMGITNRPRLWFRNVFQQKVTPPFKKPIYSPKTQFKRFSKLDDEVQDYFWMHVNNFRAMKREYMQFLEQQRTTLPGLRQIIGLAEKVGSVYPLTDTFNRSRVFTQTYTYVKSVIDEYLADDRTLQNLYNNTGYRNMQTFEQKRFNKLLETNPGELAKWVAKWNSDNSQWMYKIKERSLAENITDNRTIYNLFTWPRSLTQLVTRLTHKAAGGRGWREKRSGIVGLISLFIAAEFAKKILQKVYGRYTERRYAGYDVFQSLIWSIGGATVSEVNETMDVVGNLIFAYRFGDEKKKKRALALATRQIDGMASTFLPFVDSILAVAEVLTEREYISPLYNLVIKKAKPMDRTAVQKAQHILFRRTEKQESKGEGVGRFLRESGRSKSKVGVSQYLK